MAFAQFYYDPALEFEKLLDESEAQDHNVPAVAQSHATLPGSANSNTQSTSSVAAAQPMYVGGYLFLRKGRALNVVRNHSGMPANGKVSEPPPPSPVTPGSSGGTPVPVLLSGLFKRRASTGSADDRVAKPMTGCR